MKHLRAAINRLLDLSDKDGRTTQEAIDTIQYYFGRIKEGEKIIAPVKRENARELIQK